MLFQQEALVAKLKKYGWWSLDETENRLPELTERLPEDSTLIGDNCQG